MSPISATKPLRRKDEGETYGRAISLEPQQCDADAYCGLRRKQRKALEARGEWFTEGARTKQAGLTCARLQFHFPWVIDAQNLHKPLRTHR